MTSRECVMYLLDKIGVVEYNTRAIRFYEKLGFEPNGIKYKIRDIIPCIDMVKKNSGNKE